MDFSHKAICLLNKKFKKTLSIFLSELAEMSEKQLENKLLSDSNFLKKKFLKAINFLKVSSLVNQALNLQNISIKLLKLQSRLIFHALWSAGILPTSFPFLIFSYLTCVNNHATFHNPHNFFLLAHFRVNSWNKSLCHF